MPQQKKLTLITVVYWVLLLYIIAALIWWFIALNRQSAEMASFRISQLSPTDPLYELKKAEALSFRSRKNAQYIGEGATFFLLIVVGAVFVYRATRKQLQLVRQQQNFMMAVTHELKTPIAVTKLNLETLQRRKLDEEKQKMLLQTAINETERLNDLTNNVLLASRMDGGESVDFSQEVNVHKQILDILRQLSFRYPNRKITCDCKEHEDYKVGGDELLIRILFANLLDNAMKYTPDGAEVSVTVKKSGKFLVAEVADNGPGIPDAEKAKIFEKFYRIGNEETRSAKGTGLGLYLCRKIAIAHKGSIGIFDNMPKGSVFSVKLPSYADV
jgi:signal transduction histidine kinase